MKCRASTEYSWDIMYSRDDLWISIGYRVLLGKKAFLIEVPRQYLN